MEASSIMAVPDGCIALLDVDAYEMPGEGDLSCNYLVDGVRIDFDILQVKIPLGLLDHMFGAAVESEEGTATHVHIYAKPGYEAAYSGTLEVNPEVFLKAKGVAEYLAATAPPSL